MSFVTEISVNSTVKRSKEERSKAEDLRQKARDEDSKMVTGIFKNLEAPGCDVTFTYRKYKEESHKVYHLLDGKEYTIQLGVAKHLNNMTGVPERAYATDPSGGKQLYTIIKGKKQRYQFTSTEFM